MTNKKFTYIVLGSRPWNRKIFDDRISKYQGKWYFIDSYTELTKKRVDIIKAKYLFFMHWSWKVPDEIIKNYECICFHMTDVPYGRGGTPLQNLILRGHKTTKLTALRMTEDFDAGPVYLKKDLDLSGNAQDIYIRASNLAADIIKYIIAENPKPLPQKGKPVIFKRRKPEESKIPKGLTLPQLYDFIRMLDAEGYPKAFINYNGYKYEFSDAEIKDNQIGAKVTIGPMKEVRK